MEEVKDKKNMTLIFSIMIVALILIVGISYAFWQITKIQEDTNVIASGCFDVSLEGNEAINLANTYPMTKENGMQTTPYTFTITNTCNSSSNYIINLEALSNTTFQSESIRVALDNNSKLYSEYIESNKYFSDSKEARILISGTLEENENVTYNLRLWIDEQASNVEQNKIFASKIVITAGQVELIKSLADTVKLGDYISMTPTSTSYAIPTSLTGYSSNQTINPSELNLWRVISKNEDGTVDAVSEYVSSTNVYFRGQTGYINFVGALNTIATQYTDGKNVVRTRHIGYSNQIETCTEFTSEACPGDSEYETDWNIVWTALGSLVGNNPSGIATSYWLASRNINSTNGLYYGHSVNNDGNTGIVYLVNSSGSGTSGSRAIRPIVTIEGDTQIVSGDGKSEETAYTLG